MAYGKILVDQVENSDGKSLNVGPGARVFDTVTELQASTTLSDGDIVIVKERADAEYEIQPGTYTALDGDITLTSGQVAELQLKPVNDVRWWGVTLEDNVNTPATSEPTVDSTTELQSAFDRCSDAGVSLHGGANKVIGISGPVYFGASRVSIKDLTLAVYGSTWTSTEPMLTIGNALLTSVKCQDLVSENVFVDGRRIAPKGINFVGVSDSTLNARAIRCTEYQIKVGNSDVGDARACTDSVFTVFGTEYVYGEEEDGLTDWDSRTSYGLVVDSNDVTFLGGTFSNCKYNLYTVKYYNVKYIGCTFFAGGSRTQSQSMTAIINEESYRSNFVGCRFDDGAVEVRSFGTKFSSCQFIQFGYQNLYLTATTADEDLSGFEFIGNKMGSSDLVPTLQTEGDGSFADNLNPMVSSNITSDGVPFVIGNMSNNIKRVSSGGTPIAINGRVATYNTSADDGGYFCTTFSSGNYFYPAYRGAKSKSDTLLDFTSLPEADDILVELWGTGANGTDFSGGKGAGIRAIAATDWVEDGNSETRIDFYGTKNGSTSSSLYWRMANSGLLPGVDDTFNLGSSSIRLSNIYATNGTISTSDARLKTDLVELTDDEVNAAVAISKAMGYTWQWSEDSDSNRTHTGPTVQLIMGIMEDNNLEPFDYSFICYDEWDEQTEKVEVTPAVLDDNGSIVTEAVYEDQVVVEAGDRYSFREGELIKFCNAGLSARLDSQQETIDSILSRLDSLEG